MLKLQLEVGYLGAQFVCGGRSGLELLLETRDLSTQLFFGRRGTGVLLEVGYLGAQFGFHRGGGGPGFFELALEFGQLFGGLLGLLSQLVGQFVLVLFGLLGELLE